MEAPKAGPSSMPLRTTKETHPHLPPGLILDPDGKVCKVCNSWQDWGKMKMKKKSPAGSSSTTSSAASGMAGFAAMMGNSASSSIKQPPSDSPEYSPLPPQEVDRNDCPADTALLGRSTWTFLHTTAAYYPLKAPPQAQQNMISLLSSLSFLYPCLPCAEDFQEKVKENPPDVSGREALSRWLCERHNEVNEKLGKEKFGCDWSELNARWRDGPADGRCD
jgi:FAD-linked sulfhydryl oxidase